MEEDLKPRKVLEWNEFIKGICTPEEIAETKRTTDLMIKVMNKPKGRIKNMNKAIEASYLYKYEAEEMNRLCI